MATHVKDGGTWREVTDPQVRVSGTWREIQEIWAKDGGTWRQVFNRISISLSTLNGDTVARTALTSLGADATTITGVRLETDGGMQTSKGVGTSTDWQDYASGEYASTEPDAGVGSDYDCRLTVNSGSSPNGGDSTATWLALSSERDWTLSVTGQNTNDSGNWTLEIRPSGGGSTLASATFDAQVSISTI